MTIQSEINQTDSSKHLSLREAAQLYGYSRDHLGLMIRRNKLKGVRLGNYYATSKEWMDEYVKNYSYANNPKSKSKFSNRFRNTILEKKPSFITNSAPVAKSYRKPKAFPKLGGQDLTDLQKHINEVLSQAAPIMVSSVPPARSKVQLADTNIISQPMKTGTDHEIIILPIRKMRDFERQIIISQAKQQNGN